MRGNCFGQPVNLLVLGKLLIVSESRLIGPHYCPSPRVPSSELHLSALSLCGEVAGKSGTYRAGDAMGIGAVVEELVLLYASDDL